MKYDKLLTLITGYEKRKEEIKNLDNILGIGFSTLSVDWHIHAQIPVDIPRIPPEVFKSTINNYLKELRIKKVKELRNIEQQIEEFYNVSKK